MTTQYPSGAVIEFRNAAPGQETTSTVIIRNDGSAPVNYFLSNEATGSSILWTDRVNGLQMEVRRNDASGPLLYQGPLNIGRDSAGQPIQVPMTNAGPLAPGAEDRLFLRVYLPRTADNDFQGKSLTVTFIWTAS